ncbi:hypothetical protein Glove_341g7 [Diversispora epigaea]|uniref:Uncharacterized protein n=1 Tax=Diversispora epigaea TaxID=1348612 RepID=A0A397HJK3_9GLOM|nr:hypothetical protein Glove_341g7 [Diversispora epigaea]
MVEIKSHNYYLRPVTLFTAHQDDDDDIPMLVPSSNRHVYHHNGNGDDRQSIEFEKAQDQKRYDTVIIAGNSCKTTSLFIPIDVIRIRIRRRSHLSNFSTNNTSGGSIQIIIINLLGSYLQDGGIGHFAITYSKKGLYITTSTNRYLRRQHST